MCQLPGRQTCVGDPPVRVYPYSGVWMLPSGGKPPYIEGQPLAHGVCQFLPSVSLTHPYK